MSSARGRTPGGGVRSGSGSISHTSGAGRLQLIDCQNLFCEVDKYARVVHPEFVGLSGRSRIKQRFVAAPRPIPQWYPPKWNVHPPASAASERRASGRARQLALPA